MWKKLKNQHGFSLVEVLIASAILLSVAVAFLFGISTVLKANNTSENQYQALRLAESQLESLNAQDYQVAPSGGQGSYTMINSGSYTISSVNYSDNVVDNVVYGVPWRSVTGTCTSPDAGLQKITVIIKQNGSELLRLSTFKVKLN